MKIVKWSIIRGSKARWCLGEVSNVAHGPLEGMLDANMTYSKHILSCYPCPQTTKHQYNCNISSYKHPILYWDRHCLATSNFQKRIHLIYRHPLIMNLHCKYIKSREDKHSPLSSFTTHLLIEKILFLFKIFTHILKCRPGRLLIKFNPVFC